MIYTQRVLSCLPSLKSGSCCYSSNVREGWLIRRESFTIRSSPFGLRCWKIGLLYWVWLRLVITPKYCKRASSTCSSSREWIAVGGLWVKTGWSLSGVSFTENSELQPTSSPCFAKRSRNSTYKAANCCFSSASSIDSFHLNLCKNWLRYSIIICGSLLSSWSSVNILFSTPFSADGFWHVSGIWN